MSTTSQTPKPEQVYSGTTDPAARRRLQAAVVAAYLPHVIAAVRKTVPPQHVEDGVQAGLLGVLLALQKLEPAKTNEAFDFWPFALPYVRDAVQSWADHAIAWRPRARKERDATEARALHSQPRSFDEPHTGLHNFLPSPDLSPEELYAEAEASALFGKFLATLSDDDRRLLTCERRERSDGGVEKGNNVRARRYLLLVERATAFVKGSESRGPRNALLRRNDTLRP